MYLYELSCSALCSNALVLPVVVEKLVGVALGTVLMDPTHRYAGLTPQVLSHPDHPRCSAIPPGPTAPRG
eukprot:2808464-Prymnesium_polylepis.1